MPTTLTIELLATEPLSQFVIYYLVTLAAESIGDAFSQSVHYRLFAIDWWEYFVNVVQ